ncbi:Glycerol-3-phosphate dehydrogenase [NAD(+)], partial [Tetrabaena socialis]
ALLPSMGVALNPSAAAAMMAFSSVAVVSNSLMLRAGSPQGREGGAVAGEGVAAAGIAGAQPAALRIGATARAGPFTRSVMVANGNGDKPYKINTEPTDRVLSIWRKVDAVCFDVDCTVTINDSLDLLAEFMGVKEEVEALTNKGLAEMRAFARALYPSVRDETFLECCGVGDLVATCYGGRNRLVAEAWAKAQMSGTPRTFESLETELLNGQKLQGVLTSNEVQEILKVRKWQTQYPLFTTINRIINGELPPKFVVDFMTGCQVDATVSEDESDALVPIRRLKAPKPAAAGPAAVAAVQLLFCAGSAECMHVWRTWVAQLVPEMAHLELILPLAAYLGIPKENVFANRMNWQWDDETGEPTKLMGFDLTAPTSRNQGKVEAIAGIRQRNPYNTVVMIGDGITDLEAVQQTGGADLFIGFGGVIERPMVAAEAEWFVYDYATLVSALARYKVAMVGAGAWACAAVRMVAENTEMDDPADEFVDEVTMWTHESDYQGRKLTEVINETHENPRYMPGVSLGPNVRAEPNLEAAVKDADLIIFCAPHQFMHGICKQLIGKVKPGASAISLTKGMRVRPEGPQLISQMVRRNLGINCAVLMGANIATGVLTSNEVQEILKVRKWQTQYPLFTTINRIINGELPAKSVVDFMVGCQVADAVGEEESDALVQPRRLKAPKPTAVKPVAVVAA